MIWNVRKPDPQPCAAGFLNEKTAPENGGGEATQEDSCTSTSRGT
jgi:hypothetical protein